MDEILKELSKPFHPSHVTWKPGVFNREKNKALALAYADLRAYQNRLDEICGMGWSVSYTPWGDRIVCHLTINGVTRSSTGEPSSDNERSEIAGTAAEAQAFKRACAMFGLGRYLYNLPTVWVEFDSERKQFTEQGRGRLAGIIVQHYRRHMDPDLEITPEMGLVTNTTPGPDLLEELNTLGSEIYGEQWPHVRRHNTERISGGGVADPAALDDESVKKLIDGLKKLKRQRQAA